MKYLWLVFVVMTVATWGCYVPTIHKGQELLGGGKPSLGGLRAFLCVGGAYFVTAVVIPAILLWYAKVEPTKFELKGTTVAFLAGVLGAVGALGIILAIKNGGHPLYVAPLVFAGAPIVNVFISMGIHPPDHKPSPIFYLGLIMAALGAGIVLWSKPAGHKPPPATAQAATPTQTNTH